MGIDYESMKSIIEKNADGILIVDPEGIACFVNPAAEILLNRKAQELVGESVGVPVFLEGTELTLNRVDTSEVIVETRVVEINWKGSAAYLVSMRDITERREAENTIKKQKKQLEMVWDQISSELDHAKEAQVALLPDDVPKLNNLKLGVLYRPTNRIGGDFYDFVTDNSSDLGILIGDVTGHSIPAALLSFLFVATFRSHLARFLNPCEPIRHTNDFLAGKLPWGRYASMFFGKLEAATRIFHFCRAGHPPPVLLRSESEKPEYLDMPGMVVGMFENPIIPFSSQCISLEPGDRILFYTDGIVEVDNCEGERLDLNSLLEYILTIRQQPIQNFLDSIYQFCVQFSDSKTLKDDVTLIGLEAV